MNPTPYGPGKFKYRIDAWVYSLSLDGCDEEIHAEEYGSDWYGMFRGIVVEGSFCDLTPVAVDEFQLQPNDIAFLQLHAAGCIISEDEQGFVDVRWFTDPKERDEIWAKIRADLEESAQEREAS